MIKVIAIQKVYRAPMIVAIQWKGGNVRIGSEK
jgi:hypothetical protein